MAAPSLIGTSGNTWTTVTGTSRVTGSLSWQTNDLIVVLGMTEDNVLALISGVAATGLSFSAISGFPTNTANTCKGYAFSAVAGSDGSGTITATVSINTMSNIQAWVYRGSDGLGNNAKVSSGTALTISLVRGSDNSAVVWVAGDWGATNDTTVAASPSGGTQRQATNVSNRATMFAFDWGDQGAAGTTSYGISGFAPGNVFTKVAVEIKGTASASTVKQLAALGVG